MSLRGTLDPKSQRDLYDTIALTKGASRVKGFETMRPASGFCCFVFASCSSGTGAKMNAFKGGTDGANPAAGLTAA